VTRASSTAVWFGQVTPKDSQDWAKLETKEALDAEAMLFGRRSYDGSPRGG